MKKMFGIWFFVVAILISSTTAVSLVEKANVENFPECIDITGKTNSDNWPMFHHDLHHTGHSASIAPNYRYVLWTFKAAPYIRSSPAVINGNVYIGAHGGINYGEWFGRVYCLDGETGQSIWRYDNSWEWIFSSPAVADGRVYFGGHDCHLHCLNEDDGSELWSYETGYWVYGSPAVSDEKVYFGSSDSKVYCIDAITGEHIWDYKTGKAIWSSPAVVNDRVYIGSKDDNLYCLDAATGEAIWNKTLGVGSSSPTVVDGKVYIGTTSSKIYCLDAATGEIIWSSNMSSTNSSPAVAYGKVYIAGYTHIYCFDSNDGRLVWKYDTFGKNIFSSPAVADDKVYIGQNDDFLYCLDAHNGNLLWKHKTGWSIFSSPAVADGKVYVGSEDGYVYAFAEPASIPPNIPSITGPSSGKIYENHDYLFSASDPDGDDVSFYIDWGDGIYTDWTDYVSSSQETKIFHTWSTEGTYQIKAKAKDIYDVESDWATLEVSMPKNKVLDKSLFIQVFKDLIEKLWFMQL